MRTRGKQSPATCFHAGFLLDLFFEPEDESHMFLRNTWVTFSGLLGVISKKIGLFVSTAVKTSNSTCDKPEQMLTT
jgi:hypothetical protein